LLFPSVPAGVIFEIAGPEEAKNLAVFRLIQIRFTDAKPDGNSIYLSTQFRSHSPLVGKNFACLGP
jgi:hypothetical protein